MSNKFRDTIWYMKNSIKSYVLPLSLIVAILAIGCGIYSLSRGFQNSQSGVTIDNALAQSMQANVTQSTSSQLPSPSYQNGKIILLVDNTLLNGLNDELKTYSQDVKRELGLNTVIRPVMASDTVLTLKSYVTNFYKQNGLSGVLIIGNVPSGQMYNSDLAGGTVFDSEGYVLGDWIYQDVFGACIYSFAKNAFDDKDPECQTGNTTSLYWVARLTPNSTIASSLSLLKSYFQRNHAFRTSKVTFKNNLLSYLPIISVSQSPAPDLQGFTDRIPGYGTYSTTQAVFIDPNDQNSDQKYFAELAKPNNYEAVIYDGHGAPTFQMKNIKPTDITNTSFVFLDLLSCSVGRFTTPDYLAGQYLFNGGLIEVAATTPVFAATQYDADTYEMLSLGIPFFKAFEYSGFGNNVLGDPTLQMRYNNNNSSKNGPRMVVPTKDLSFSTAHPDQTITIKNSGTKPLLFAVRGKPVQQKNSSFIKSFGVGLDSNATSANNKPYTLLPGKTTTLSFQTKYYFPYDTIPAGKYKEEFYIVSNDPANPLIEINLNYSVLNSDHATSTLPAQPPQPSINITVTYPNGGEQFSLGVKDVDFRTEWTSNNLTGNVDVYLHFPDGGMCLIKQGVPVSQGYLTATLGTNYKCPNTTRYLTAGQYKVLLDIPDNPKLGDESNNYFTISLASLPTPITQQSPTIQVYCPSGFACTPVSSQYPPIPTASGPSTGGSCPTGYSCSPITVNSSPYSPVPNQISSCMTISQPGIYQLTQDVSAPGTCFTITSSNVVIDGESHSVSGPGFVGHVTYGVLASGVTNITIDNVSISNFTDGIHLSSVSTGSVQNTNSHGNSFQGLDLSGSTNITVANNKFTNNGQYGIAYNNSNSGNQLINNVITNNGEPN